MVTFTSLMNCPKSISEHRIRDATENRAFRGQEDLIRWWLGKTSLQKVLQGQDD